jgi:hypothetical protein
MPERAPVLTVSDCLESSRLLYDDGLANGFVFDLRQGCRIDGAILKASLSGVFHRLRSQQAADMIGSKYRFFF